MKKFRVSRRRRREDPDQGRPGRARRRGSKESANRPGRAPVWPQEVPVPWARLLSHLLDARDRDRTVWQLLEELGLGTDLADDLRDQLALLEAEGLLAHHRRGRVRLRSRDRIVLGRIAIPASSARIGRHWGSSGAFGFVRTADPSGDLYIPSRGLAGARHGDLVLARETGTGRDGRSQGAVVAILERAPSRIAGEVVERDGRLFLRPRKERLSLEVPLETRARASQKIESKEGHRRRGEGKPGEALPVGPAELPDPGDLVVADLVGEAIRKARVLQVIGPSESPGSFEALIRAEMNLPGEFPPDVEEEAARVALPVSGRDLEGRRDFRGETVLTIDPEDARDFDDAIGFERLAGGGVRLWVHIADVAHYARPGGAVDREALERGTSIYFPGAVIPMIPHSLSSGICSLKPGEERLVQSVGLDYTREGELKDARCMDGVIRSRARLTYEEAAAILEDPGSPGEGGDAAREVAGILAALGPLAKRLTGRRRERGALDLELPEIEFDRGKEGGAASIRAHDRNDAHRLIEEFMLAANEAVARRLDGSGLSAIYRVHEAPDLRDIRKVEESLAPLGLSGKKKGSLAVRLQRILIHFAGMAGEEVVAKQVLRAMKLARYAAGLGDHFGLALTHYTHFTSPIRRYPDLLVHRILRASRKVEGGGAGLPGTARVAEIAAECSRLERRAEEAERAVNDLLLARHMGERIGETFDGRVSGLTRRGIFVALEGGGLPPGLVEGYAPTDKASGYVLTEPVRVRVEETDSLRGKIRLGLVEA